MEETPYQIASRNISRLGLDKENRQLRDPLQPVCGAFFFGSKKEALRQAPPLRDLWGCNLTSKPPEGYATMLRGEYPVIEQPVSPLKQQPMFEACVHGQSPGQTPMPRPFGLLMTELPNAPMKPASPATDCLVTPAPFASDARPHVEPCQKRGTDRLLRVAAGSNGCHRVRVRRALDLQTSAGQSAQGRTTSTASTQLRMRPAPPTAAANPAVRPALAPAAHGEQHSSSSLMGSPGNLLQAWARGGQLLPALARKRLVPMEEEEDEQGLRRMRSRDRAWAAAAEGMAELHISNGSLV